MYKNLVFAIGLVFLFASCGSETADNTSGDANQPVTVKEVIQSSNYTYLKVDENGAQKWMAVTRMDAKTGDKYYYAGAMEMQNFESKELQRTFDKILFVDHISAQPITTESAENQTDDPHAMTNPHGENNPHSMDEMVEQSSGKHEAVKAEVKLEIPADAVSIGELYKNRKQYEGKTIKVTGVVTKFSPAIMNKNWVHLQDGTEHDGLFDLTVTTLEAVEEGQTVVFEGKIALEKDFGYGYYYDVLMEEAVLK